MRSCFVLFVAFAMAAVVPVTSAPAPGPPDWTIQYKSVLPANPVDYTEFEGVHEQWKNPTGGTGVMLEKRDFFKSFLDNPVVKTFSSASSYLQMMPVMDAPKGL